MPGFPHEVTAAEPGIRPSVSAGPERTLAPAYDRKPSTCLAAAPAAAYARDRLYRLRAQQGAFSGGQPSTVHDPRNRHRARASADPRPRLDVCLAQYWAHARLGPGRRGRVCMDRWALARVSP